MSTWAVLLLLSLNFAFSLSAKCPFNDDCECTAGSSTITFKEVVCGPKINDKEKKFPVFTPKPGVKYILEQLHVQLYDASTIPANHFAAFESIAELTIIHDKAIQNAQKWDDNAFSNVKIDKLTIWDLANVIPIPKALKIPTFKALVFRGKNPKTKLPAGGFSGLTNNTVNLRFFDMDITDISPDAFSGLENLRNLEFIEKITYENLLQLKPAVSKLTGLERMSLYRHEVAGVDLDVFSQVPSSKKPTVRFWGSNLDAVSTSNTGKFPSGLTIDFTDALPMTIDTINANVGQLLQNNDGLKIDISRIRLGLCQNFVWIKDMECPKKLVVDNTQCKTSSGDMPLVDYLQSKTCQKSK